MSLPPGLFEAVPNFSEGRDARTISALGAAAASAGALLLDSDHDPDHNRLVLSLGGSAPGLADGLQAAVDLARHRIDLRRHSGVHPRVGAADVVPLVPIGDTRLEAAVSLAHGVGERIWTELRLPIYFYGAAATAPGRERLATIRSGSLAPDLGGPELDPEVGAVCVGARRLLVAYNVLLPSASPEQARAIAKAIRQSSGGLPGVQALAFPVRAGAQVSMNLVDLEATSPAMALATVRRLAAELGVEVGADQVVGLCPARFAPPSAAGRILEARMAGAAAAAAAGRCRRLGDQERLLMAVRLEAEAGHLRRLETEPAAILAAAERTAALRRLLPRAGVADEVLDAILQFAAGGLRAAVDRQTAARFPVRVTALDRWLAGSASKQP